MIELRGQKALVFSFPEVHPQAQLTVTFVRTLRVPDDGHTYPLPPGLGLFPLRHLDDHAGAVPQSWLTSGGVMLPMYQSEALWLYFTSAYIPNQESYPFALKVAAGKINALTGEPWSHPLQGQPQDYLVVPPQPWLDGFAVGPGLVRQFVAMPLGSGCSAEEQITGRAEVGGIQLMVYPMKRSVFEERFPQQEGVCDMVRCCSVGEGMGLSPGGKLKQQIFADPFELDDWDTEHSGCFAHIVNSRSWLEFTGQLPPHPPITAQEYNEHGFPWFDYYRDELAELMGSQQLARLKSLVQMMADKSQVLPYNQTIEPRRVVRVLKEMVREGEF
ncbi:MAG: hypothetical protein AB7S38_36975 [Vulcanimicrobiota bacterium]